MAGDNVTIKMGGSAADALREIDKLIKKEQEVAEGFDGVSKKVKITKKDIQDLASNDGGLSRNMSELTKGMAAQFVGFTSILGAVQKGIDFTVEAMRKGIELGKEAATLQAKDRPALASLSQQARSPEDLKRLIKLAEETYTSGGADSMDEAKSVVAQLNSMPGGLKSREGLAKLKAAGVISDVGGLVRSENAVQFAMGGADKAGDIGTLTGKSLAAAQASGGMASAEGIMAGTAAAAKVARTAGLSPDEVMAAVTTLARTGTDAGEAGSQIAGLERKINSSFPSLRGKSLEEQIETINGMHKSPKALQKLLGREGRQAFGALSPNMGEYDSTLETIQKAGPAISQEKLAQVAATPELAAPQLAEEYRRKAEEALKKQRGTIGSLSDAASKYVAKHLEDTHAGSVTKWLERQGYLEGNQEFVERTLRSHPQEETSEMRRQYAGYLHDTHDERPDWMMEPVVGKENLGEAAAKLYRASENFNRPSVVHQIMARPTTDEE